MEYQKPWSPNNNSGSAVMVDGNISDPFDVPNGVLRGDVLAPFHYPRFFHILFWTLTPQTVYQKLWERFWLAEKKNLKKKLHPIHLPVKWRVSTDLYNQSVNCLKK